MNKKFLLLGAGLISAMFAGSTVKAPVAEQIEDAASSAKTVSAQAASRKPAPAKPTNQPATQRQVVVRQAPLASMGFTHFVEKPHLRKVKYGKRRWVMV